jgi:hypothetical protein
MLANHNPVNDHCLVSTDVGRPVWNADLEKAMMFGGWLELAYRGARFTRLKEPTYLYRRHTTNMSDTDDPRFTAFRKQLVHDYSERVARRDGSVPGPSIRLRARRLVASPARAVLRLTSQFGGPRA